MRALLSAKRSRWFHRPASYLPKVEVLEDRLPPGEVLSEALLSRTLIEPTAAVALVAKPAAGSQEGAVLAADRTLHVDNSGGARRDVDTTLGYRAEVSGREGRGTGRARDVPFTQGLEDPFVAGDLDPWPPWTSSRWPHPRPRRQPPTLGGGEPGDAGVMGGQPLPGERARPDDQPVSPGQPPAGVVTPFNQAVLEGVAGQGQGNPPPTPPAPLKAQPDVVGNNGNGHVPPPPHVGMPAAMPPTCSSDCNCSDNDEVIQEANGVCDIGNMDTAFSDGGVRYADGVLNYNTTDLRGDGFGTRWGHTRAWSNGPGYDTGSFNGHGMVDKRLPFIMPNGGQLVAVTSGVNARYFVTNDGGTTYASRFYVRDTIKAVMATHEFVLTDSKGDTIRYDDLSYSGNQQGQFKSFTDPYGNTIAEAQPRTADGKVQEMQRTDAATGLIESYLYTYITATNDPNVGLLENVTLRRKPSGGNWSTVRQVEYAYYGSGDANGNPGDLKFAKTEDGATPPNVLDTMYYRYYTTTGGVGFTDGLKYAFSAASYAQLVAANGGADPSNLPDATVAPYADQYLEYDPATTRITTQRVQGRGASCPSCGGSGQGTFTFSYTPNTPGADLFNSWTMKTVETLPDNNPGLGVLSQNVVYTNSYGQVLLKVYQRQVGGGPLQQWEWYYKYDADGRLLLKANPSALSGYNDSLPDLIDQSTLGDNYYLNASTGLIERTQYNSTDPTTLAPGYFYEAQVQQGRNGALVLQQKVTYANSPTVNGVTVYPVATSSVYQSADGSGEEQTSYSYGWYSGTLRVRWVTVSRPLVAAGQNGPDTAADVDKTFYDVYGRPVWHRDSVNLSGTTPLDGYIDYTAYDPATGAATKFIQDVKIDPQHAPDYDNQTPPDGWTTRSDGGLHLFTQMQVDNLGRTTKLTDPNGNVSYTVYHDPTASDPNYEVRTYAGWNSGTGFPTGPTRVMRIDRTHSPSYVEAITMAATPATSDGLPTGTEAISAVQSLTRSYVNPGGQVFETDDYFYLPDAVYSRDLNPGIAGTVNTDGTVSGNYWKTLYGYDGRGRQNKVQAATGTVTRSVYDGLSRPVSSWVGTNDYGANDLDPSNGGMGGNNMVQVSASTYDGGGIGDGNLTKRLDLPSGSTQAADVRETDNLYDWRDRLVVSKQGVQGTEDTTTHRPIFYHELDNLGEETSTERYDGDTVTLNSLGSTNGVPNRPAPARLRAKTVTKYDSQGRVYQINLYSVNQVTGALSANTLNANFWYDHRGNLIKSSKPDGLVTKVAYDGADRDTVTYTSDEAATPTWADAFVVTNNHVLTQTETGYDNNGNAVLITTRDRFHDATATGALQGPSGTGPNARVSYVASYYDAANRLIELANVGTNQGQPFTWNPDPTTLPTGTLTTKDSYGADAVQQVMVTGSGSFTLTFKNQTTDTIPSTADAATVQSRLQALGAIGPGNALVRGPIGGPWLVRFVGPALGGLNQPDMTATGTGVSVTIATAIRGGDGGRLQQVTDPRGLVTKTDYDLLSRTLRTVEAFANFAPANASDRTTEFTYDGDGNLLTLSAVLPTSTQTTQYVYGVTGVIASKDLLAQVIFPPNGKPNTESYTYNALGQVATKADRNGNTHAYSYDVLGRRISDAVTVLGNGVDGTVRRLDTAYDTGGRPYLYTSYADTTGTTVVNQVKQVYNGLGQLLTEYQAHAGAVTGTTPSVQYTYNEMASGANNSRLTSMIYPNGRVVNYNYANGLDDSISRITSLQDNGAT